MDATLLLQGAGAWPWDEQKQAALSAALGDVVPGIGSNAVSVISAAQVQGDIGLHATSRAISKMS